uniref:Odorant binding protein n=1 Tax=Cylas formicarius TaxID=197179 RepID=A0A6B7LZZ6_CYLFO|nr:odorant binding protein [Cylas formicarius]
MNQLVLVMVLICSVYSQLQLPPERLQVVMKYNAECQKESKVPQMMLMNTLRGEFEEDDRLKNHLFCLGKRMNYIDGEGNFNETEIRKDMSTGLSNDRIEVAVKECLVRKATPIQTAFDSIHCISKEYRL